MASRRDQIVMTRDEVQTFLRSARTIILVTNGNNGFPHPMPMWFGLDNEGEIVMTTFRKSQKVLNIRRDPKVTLLAEAGDEYSELRSVLIYAHARVIDDLETTTDALLTVSRTRGEVPESQESMVRQGMLSTAAKRVVLRFDYESVVSWDHRKLGGKY